MANSRGGRKKDDIEGSRFAVLPMADVDRGGTMVASQRG
jgi:hypothetical protein